MNPGRNECHKVVSNTEWVEARLDLLAKEKEFTKLRDELSQARRNLPWERVSKNYIFDGPNGKASLADIFAGRSQLIVYHFMFAPEWDAGCKHCSWWADNFERNVVHLDQRDVTMVAISRAPVARLEAFKRRMGWTFKWYSSGSNDFNFDYQVSWRPDQLAAGEVMYNFSPKRLSVTDLTGISVFYKDSGDDLFHTYSCFARGVDMMNTGYQYLDLVPKGRDETGMERPQAWVRHRDNYGQT
jgi:predicted dithiol-disulfide oxidoreductase (DUF899 family)